MQVTDVCAVIAIGLSSQFGLRGRLPWDGNRGREYVADVERFFYSTPWLEHEVPGFDICLYNAGMDPFEGCSIGGIEGVTQKVLRDREMTVSHGVGCEAFPSCSSLRGDTSARSLSARGSWRSTGSLSKRRVRDRKSVASCQEKTWRLHSHTRLDRLLN